MTRKIAKPKLDAIDKRILHELQLYGRISNIELSKKVNLSPTPCLERVRRLEKANIIQSYHATLNPIKTNAALLVFVEVTLEHTNNEVFKTFADQVKEYPQILECHMIAGGFDYLLKMRFKDMQHYRQFLGKELASLPGVSQTHTYMVMEEVKSSSYIDLSIAEVL